MLPILEASQKLKMTPSAIRGKLNRGKLKGEKRIINGKEAWFVEVDEVEAIPIINSWVEFEAQWHKAMNNGSVYGKPLSPNTQRIYKTGVSMFFELLGKPPDIELLTTENLLNALTNVQPNARGCRYTQKMHVYDGFRAIVRLLVAQNKANRLLLADATQFKPKRFTEAYQPHITGDVLEDLLHVANSWRMGKTYTDVKRLDLGIRLAGYMGLRRAEIVGLKRSDLKAGERSLRVLGKGRKYRLLYIPDNVIDALNQWILETDCWGSPWVFPDRTTDNHLTGEALYQQFNKIVKHFNGIRAEKKQPPISLHLHGLRHTAVTEWVKDRHSTEDISKWVGHSSPETTRRIYSHLTEEDTFRMMREKLA